MLPALHAAGYRTYVPWLRGYGPTRFLRDATPRSGQLVALGQDLVEFATALGLGRHALVGHDWGARAAYIASALNEEHVCACVALSVGYGTNNPGQTISYRQTQNYWYHWFMATPRGERHLRGDRRAFTRHVWNEWFVAYKPDAAEFERTAASFDNPDWADITLHSYRSRWGHAPGYPEYAALDARFDPAPKQRVPTLTLHGDLDPVNSPQMSEGKEGLLQRALRAAADRRRGTFPAARAPRGNRDADRRLARSVTADPRGTRGASRWRRRAGLHHRVATTEPFEPGRGIRPTVAPAERGETEVEIAERATEGDRAEVHAIAESRGALVQRVEPGSDFVELAGGPVVPAQVLRAHRGFIARQEGGAQDAIGERMLHQDAPALRSGTR